MDPQSLLGNLLASAIAFAAGVFFRTGLRYWRVLRPRRRALGFADSQRVTIVVSDKSTSDGRRRSELFESDVFAATAVMASVRSVLPGAEVTVTTAARLNSDGGLEGDLVVVGGPGTNRVYRAIASGLTVPFSFQIDCELPSLIRNNDGAEFPLVVDNDGHTVRDHGLVVFSHNPFRQDSRVWLLAGCGLLGTMAAARMLSEPYLSRIPPEIVRAGHGAFVVKTEVIEGFHTTPRVVAVDVDI